MPTITVVRIYADGSGDFTSLKAGWDANKTNLVTADVALEFELKGNLINTDAFVDATGYTTDATRNITIRPIAGDETTSVAGTSGTVYGTNTFILVCRGEFVLFKSLEVDGFSNPFHTASNLTVQDCLIHDGTLVADTVGASVSNTIIYNCAANTLDNVDCDQVTIVSKTSMITTMYRNAGGVLTRNVAYNTSVGNVNYSNTTNASNDENASDDTTAPGTTTFSVSTSDFVNYASDDFDIDSGSSLFTAGSGGTRIGALLTVSGGVTVTADSGTYLYTGTDADLLVSRIMQANSGSYSYTGTSINLLKGFILSAQSGSYSYLGQDATLTYTPVGANILIADAGSYAITGANINFNRDRVIIASSGTYNYNGTDIQIILPGQIWTDKPSVSTNWDNQANVTTIWTDK